MTKGVSYKAQTRRQDMTLTRWNY